MKMSVDRAERSVSFSAPGTATVTAVPTTRLPRSNG